jgi:HPt (histidine-containing phosphotransfer) domain-containing protein
MTRCIEDRGVQTDAASDAAPALGGFDHATYQGILEVVGQERLLRLLDRLAQMLRDHITAEQAREEKAREGLESMAHQLVSAAGALGFGHLADLCRELEDACARRADVAEITLKLDGACASALVEIEMLKAALLTKT